MSESKKRSPTNDRNNNTGGRKRNLPSWMSDREDTAAASASTSTVVTKPMDGVVFVLSGFVNPERGMLRSHALEMGAEYQQDWNSSCTLLVCAFPNTPKFRQVEADSGTIVSKEWISECYKQRKLVEIEPYLMHAGKPWKKQSTPPGIMLGEQSPSKEVQKRVEKNSNSKDQQSSSKESQKRVEKSSNLKLSSSALSKDVSSDSVNDLFSPSKVKQWAVDDFKKTLSWLESQDEKPDTSEIQKIAAEGILTCLQDTIDTLKQGQSIQQIAEQWACLPRVVEELAKLDSASWNDTASVSTEDLCKQAMNCKRIYELQYSRMGEKTSPVKKPETRGSGKAGNEEKDVSRNKADYDSDETIEMTEDEIDKAFDTITSTFADTG